MATYSCTLIYLLNIFKACGYDLAIKTENLKLIYNFGHHIASVCTDIIKTVNIWSYKISSCFCRDKRLGRSENGCHKHTYSLRFNNRCSFKTCLTNRHFDIEIATNSFLKCYSILNYTLSGFFKCLNAEHFIGSNNISYLFNVA